MGSFEAVHFASADCGGVHIWIPKVPSSFRCERISSVAVMRTTMKPPVAAAPGVGDERLPELIARAEDHNARQRES